MQVRKGWAAFLALVVIILLGSSSALAGDGQPVIGCFNPGNASLLGRLGPLDAGVRSAFSMGGCLSLSPDVPFSSAGKAGENWQLQLLGSPVPFFTPDWGAPMGNRNADATRPQAYATFVPQSAQLMSSGRLFAYCDKADEELAQRWHDFRRRWDAYDAERGRSLGNTTMVVRRHFTDRGPRLVQEADALQSERSVLERKCAPVRDLVLDEIFARFVETLH